MWETRHPPKKLMPLTDWRSANKTRHSTTTHFKTKLANQRCDYSTLDFAGGQYFLNVAFKIPPKRTRRPPARSLNTIVHQMDHTPSRKTYDLVRKHQPKKTMSQISITPTFHIKRPGGMREAVRRPTGDGVLDTIQDLLGSDPRFSGNFGILVPPYYSPQGPCTFRRADPEKAVEPLWAPPKTHSKFQSIFVGILDSKMRQKASQNPFKI